MCHPGWPVTHNVYQVVLELTKIYLSLQLELKV